MAHLKRARDGQQWILDYLTMTTGRDRNFGVDHHLWPPNVAKSHRMVPRVLTRIGEELEGLARASDAQGHADTAIRVYYQAVEAYRGAQHAITADLPQKHRIYEQLNACYDRIIRLSPYPIERVEVPWEGQSIPALFHYAAASEKAPTVLFIPGMDSTKEAGPRPDDNFFLRRGLNALVMDGPGQGECNIRGIHVTDDNYERAASAAIDWLTTRPEVDANRIGVMGFSMGSFWAPRTAAADPRVKALVAALGVFGDKRYIFDVDSPHFKQTFMYMAGLDDEDEFDLMAARMTLRGHASRIACPTLLCSGEFDPLSPLEETYAVYDELAGPKELWVIADEAHRLHWVAALGGMSVWHWCLDWMKAALDGQYSPGYSREVYVERGGNGPFAAGAPEPAFRSWYDGVAT